MFSRLIVGSTKIVFILLVTLLSYSCQTQFSIVGTTKSAIQPPKRFLFLAARKNTYGARHYVVCKQVSIPEIQYLDAKTMRTFSLSYPTSHAFPIVPYSRLVDLASINSRSDEQILQTEKMRDVDAGDSLLKKTAIAVFANSPDTTIQNPAVKIKRQVPPILVAGILTSILGVLLLPLISGPLGIVLCWIGFQRIRRAPEKWSGRALAVTGMLSGLFTFALGLYLLIFALAFLLAA